MSFDVSIPITSPSVSAMASVWSWCSKGNLLNATQVGNARLLGLSGLNPGTQLWIMQVPHFDLKGDSIKVLCFASESSPLRKKNPLPTFIQRIMNYLLVLGLGLEATFLCLGGWVWALKTLQSIVVPSRGLSLHSTFVNLLWKKQHLF